MNLICPNLIYQSINNLSFIWFQATALYKLVAERGPWSSLSRWALESYLKGDVGKAFFLYSRMAELGYEVAQSNAAWILDKYGERSMCMAESEFCTDAERHQRAHSLWWQASEQGNEHAALLIGDAYYYGRVCVSNWNSSLGAQVSRDLGQAVWSHAMSSLIFLSFLRVLRETIIVQQKLTCMPNPNLMHKPCLTLATCMSMAKDFHLISILPSDTMIKP